MRSSCAPWLAGVVLAGTLLGGCGEEPGPAGGGVGSGTPSQSSSGSPTGSSSDVPEPAPDPVLVSGSAAGGRVSTAAVPLAGDGVRTLTAGLAPGLAAQVEEAAAALAVPPGSAAYGAVVAVGCDVPSGVVVARRDARVLLSPRKPTGKPVQCLVPVTTVALAVVPVG